MSSAEFLKWANENLDLNCENGWLTWKNNRVGRGAKNAGDRAGCLNKRDGYRILDCAAGRIAEHRLVWAMANGFDLPEGGEVDHINMVRDDNRPCNLRFTNRVGNVRNRNAISGSKSGLKGVHWKSSIGKWVSSISIGGKRIHLGVFDDKFEAKKAFDSYASGVHGEFFRP